MIFPVNSSNDCVSLPGIINSALSRAGEDKLASTITMGVRTLHANLLHEWQLSSSYYSKRRCGLDNLRVSIATFIQ